MSRDSPWYAYSLGVFFLFESCIFFSRKKKSKLTLPLIIGNETRFKRYMGLQKRLINVFLQNISQYFNRKSTNIDQILNSGELYKNSSNFNNSTSQFGALFQRINLAAGIIPNLTKIRLWLLEVMLFSGM